MYIYPIKSIYCFIPEDFLDESNRKTSNGKVLNLIYLSDLFTPFYRDYLIYQKSGHKYKIKGIKLYSKFLKEKYGSEYKKYIQFLIDKRFIKLFKKHYEGSSTEYMFLYNKMKNTKVVLKEYFNKKLIDFYNKNCRKEKVTTINKEVVKNLRANLRKVKIDKKKALEMLDLLCNQDPDKYIKNKYSIEMISKKYIYFQCDYYGRVHTNFTILKREIRKNCLTIDGSPIYEKDIKNAQPFFLLKLIADNIELLNSDESVNNYFNNVTGGIIYEKLQIGNLTRDEVKEKIYKYLFGQNYIQYPEFSKQYPAVSEFIKVYKNENKYQEMSHKLQQTESDFIFNSVCARLTKEKIIYFTIHDSVCVEEKNKERLNQIMDSELAFFIEDVKNILIKSIENTHLQFTPIGKF